MKSITEYCRLAYENAKNKGFHEKKNINLISEKLINLSLIFSELGECVEAIRKNDNLANRYGISFEELQKDTEEDELADTVIRIFDYCGLYGIDLEHAINQKMEYNKSRPYKHNKLI